jgi:F-type H+-transporting ATPase subunit a
MLCLSLFLLIFLPFAVRGKFALLKTAVEAFAIFVRDDIVYPNIGKKDGKKFVPFFCTMLLFLLLANYFAMLPGARAITGNISVTGGMAIVSFFLITGLSVKENGFVGFLKTFVPSGVPLWLVPLVFPLEVISLLIRAFVLAVRLFANMIAGHIVLLSLFAFIFIMAKLNVKAGALSSTPVLVMTLFISVLELLVAAIQAYVFTLLTAIFTGLQKHAH